MKPEDIKMGMWVTYYAVITANGQRLDPFTTHVTAEPWQLGHGAWVCKVQGRPGGVLIEQLKPAAADIDRSATHVADGFKDWLLAMNCTGYAARKMAAETIRQMNDHINALEQ